MAQQKDFIVKGGLAVQTGNAVVGGTLFANTSGVTTASIATTSGFSLSIGDLLITDTVTSSTQLSVANYIGQSTINSTGTITTAVNLWIAGPPISTGTTTINNSWAAYINTGSVWIGDGHGNPNGFSGNALQVAGGIASQNGIFVTGGGTLEGVFFLNGSPVLTAATQNTGTQFFNAQVVIDTTANSYSTATGSLVLGRGGGAGISGNVYVGGYLAVLTTATIQGTNNSVSTNTGALTIGGGLGVNGNIYALSETLKGALTADSVNILNTGSTALQVAGYAEVAKGIVAQDLTLLDSTSATGYLAAPLTVTGGAYIGANLIVASTLSNALQVAGGGIIQGNLVLNGQGLFNSNITVATTSYVAGAQIITTATVASFAVTTLTAGTDTAVSTSTGPVLVWSTATLQSLTNRGATTTNAISVLNTLTVTSVHVTGNEVNDGTVSITNTTPGTSQTGALTVAGGVAIQGALFVQGTGFVQNAQILTTATIGSYGVSALLAGTDTAVNTATGSVTVWDISTLESVTSRGATTDQAITITNTGSSTSTTTGALVVNGGVGIGGNLNVAHTSTISGDLTVGKTVTVTSSATIYGQVSLGGPVTITDTENSVSTATGSLRVGGGVGIGGDLYIGGTLINTNNLTVNENFSTYGTISVNNTTSSTGTTTGALVVEGGVGIGGTLNIGQESFIQGAQILTTATIGNYGVSSLTAGSDISVNTATGAVTISDISTLDSVAQRGNTTTATITVNNTLTAGTDLLVDNNLLVNNGTLLYTLTATNRVDFQDIQDSIDTLSGAVRIAGGLGVANSIFAGRIFDQNARVITTATIPEYAVTSLTAGTDTAVNTTTGAVLIWNTSTLQSVTDRGNATSNPISINNTGSQALNVLGGAVIQSTLNVSGTSTLADIRTTGIVYSTNTTNSTSTTTGAVTLNGGLGVQGNIYAGAVYDQNARVITTATIGSYGVSLITAGTDTAVNTSTGQVTIWNTSTLQTVTDRGNTTTNAIHISTTKNSTATNNGALVVDGGVGIAYDVNIGGNLTVGGGETIQTSLNVGTTATFGSTVNIASTSYINSAEIVTTATIGNNAVSKLFAGTDTAVSTNTGYVTVWDISTLQSVTSRGATTDQAIAITNNTQATSTTTGALVVTGGGTFGRNLIVGQNAFIGGNLTVLGTQTIVDSTSTVIIDPVVDIGGGINRSDLFTNDGLNKGIALHYYTSTNDTMFVGRDVGTGKFIVKNNYDVAYPTNAQYATSGTYADAILGTLLLSTFISSTSTTTGALVVDGGVGIFENLNVGGNVNIAGNTFIGGSAVVTTGTIGNYGVTRIFAGTDTAVNTTTGIVYVWNTSTFGTVTSRGNSTTSTINILNSGSSALTVAGGASVGGNFSVTNNLSVGQFAELGTLLVDNNATVTNILTAGQVYDNNNRVVTAVVPVAGDSIGIINILSTGTYTTFTVNNLGVTATIAGPFIGVSTSTGAVTITNLGVQQAQGSQYISVSTSTGTVIISNNGVTYLEGSSFIQVSTSTGTVQIFNAGVTELLAGDDISLSQNTGTILIADTSTLQTVTGRGATTNQAISITSLQASSNFTTGALVVAGGVGIGGALYVNNESFIANAQIITTATIAEFAVTSLTVGTDTAITTSTGAAVIWSTATLQSITGRNSTTTNFVHFANTANSFGTSTGGIVVDGGIGIGKDVYIGGTLFYSNSLDIVSTQNSTSTTTGAITVVGGVGIGENLNVGGQATFWNTTNSTGTTTGAVVIDGGLGVGLDIWANNIYSQGTLVLTEGNFKGVLDITGGTDTVVSTATGHVVIWNTSTLQTVTGRGNSTTNSINISNATVAFNTQSGALTVAGGVGIGQDLYIGGNFHGNNLYVSNTINSTNAGLYLNSANNSSSVYANGIDLLNYNAGTYYVSANNGNDSNDGRRPQSAFATLGKALSLATAGMEVYVDAGTYTETFPLTVPKGVTVRGAGLRSTIITPTTATNTSTGFLMNGECLITDLTISGFYKPGYGFAFAQNCNITTKSPYLQRVSVLTKGSVTSSSDPYGFNSGNAGNGVYLDASVLAPNSLEPAMLFNEVTFIVPNATGMYMTNGVRAELLNGFFYFANKAIDAETGNKGVSGTGQTRLKLSNVTGAFNTGDTIYYKGPAGNTLASGIIANNDGTYLYIDGPAWGFATPTTRTAKPVTFATTGSNISTAQSKFGGSSLYLNSNNNGYVYSSPNQDFQFGTGDFTIEFFVYQGTTTAQIQSLVDMRTASTADVAPYLYITAANGLSYFTNGSQQISGGTVSAGAWHHVALARHAGVTQLYLDGNQTGLSYVDTNNYVISPVKIGNTFNNASNTGMNGYVDELRISTVARYTTTFTATSVALTSDADTILLLHFDGANGATSTSDDITVTQNVYSSAGATAQEILLADYHQFGAELRCIGSAAVFGNYGVTANGTGTDLKLIAFNMSHIGSGGNLSDDVTLTVQTNEVIETNGGIIYYQTVDQNGDFRVGDHFLVNQRTGNVTFNTGAINLQNVTSLDLTDGVNTTLLTPGNIAVGRIDLGGNTIGTSAGNLTLSPATTTTEVTSNLLVDGGLTVGGPISANGGLVLTTSTIAAFGVATITAGTDTAVSTSFGYVTVWSTATLQSITNRSNSTTNTLLLLNTATATSATSGALQVSGGVGIAKDLWVSRNITANSLLVSGGNTIIGQNNINQNTNSAPSSNLSGGVNVSWNWTGGGGETDFWNLFDNAPQSFNFYQKTGVATYNTLLSLTSTGTNIPLTVISTSTNTGALTVAGGVGIGGNLNVGGVTNLTTASINFVTAVTETITGTTTATNTYSGALIVTGGVGVGGSLYAGALYDQGSRVVTAATIGSVGVSSLIAGTDTAVSSATGAVTVWNTSTLQTVTNRGNSTTNAIIINTSTPTTTIGTGALVVGGGASVAGNIYSAGNLTITGNRHTFGAGNAQTVSGQTPVVGIQSGSSSTTYQLMLTNAGSTDALALSMNQSGVASMGSVGAQNGNFTLFAGNPGVPSLTLVALTGQVQVNATTISSATNNGALVVAGGVGVGGAVNIANTSYINSAQIITTATIGQFAVSSLTAGADLFVNTATGDVTISSTATLQSVTNRGSVTTNPININNPTASNSTISGALVVLGGVGVGGSLYASNIYSNGSLVITQGTLGNNGVTSITAGTDTAISTSTGAVVIWDTSTFASVTSRGSATTSTIFINNTSSSTSALSGALQVVGGVGIGNNLYVQGTITAQGGFVGLNPTSIYQNTSSVTVIDSGTVHNVVVTIASNTNAIFSTTSDIFYVPVNITSTASSTSTTTGALTVAGGVGIQGSVNIGGTSTIAGAVIITTATINQFGVTTIVAGTDTASTLSGTTVYIWSTSTLQSITNRGSTTTNSIYITNSSTGGTANSGALQVTGGAYVGQNLYVGGNQTIIGNLTVLGTQTTILSTSSMSISDPVINIGSPEYLGPLATDDGLDKGILIHYNTLTNTSGDTHAFFGMQRSTEKFMYVTRTQQIGQIGQSNPFTSYTLGGAMFGTMSLQSGNNAINVNSGDLQVAGGAGIIKDVWIGGQINVSGSSTFVGPTQIINLTSSTTSTNGALVVAGGVGIGGNLYVGGYAIFVGGAQVVTTATLGTGGVGVVNITAGTDTAVTTASGTVTIWNTSTLDTVANRGNSTTATILILNTTSSTSTNSGALTVAGGVGIGGNLSIGGNLLLLGNENDQSGLTVAGLVNFTSVVTSTATNNGALVVGGGVGIGGNANIGGNLNVNRLTNLTTATLSGALTVNGTATIGTNVLVGTSSTTRGLNPIQVYANGGFTGNGDAQTSIYVLRTVTSSTGILTTTGLGVVPTNQIALPANSTYTFRATVTARSTTGNDEAGWLFEGVISQYANVGTTSLKVVNKTKLWSSQTGFDCAVTADTVNGALQFTATSNGANVRFVAKVETVEVTD